MPQFARLSFSMTYKEDKDNELRTLDLTCKNEQEFHLWFWGMQVRSTSICIACILSADVLYTSLYIGFVILSSAMF